MPQRFQIQLHYPIWILFYFISHSIFPQYSLTYNVINGKQCSNVRFNSGSSCIKKDNLLSNNSTAKLKGRLR